MKQIDKKTQKLLLKKLKIQKQIDAENARIKEQERKQKELDKIPKELPKLKEKPPEIIKPPKQYNPVKSGSRTDLKHWTNRFKDKFMADKAVLINFELINGFHMMFVATEREGGFKFRGKKYIFDNDSKYYILSAKLWCYDFHEDIALPIKRIIPVNDIKKALESGMTEVENAINPATLERFIKAKIAEGIMKGQQLDIALKQLKLIGIISMMAILILLILFLFKTGMLESIKIPGIS